MKYIKKFEEIHFGTESGPEDGNFQHQQADSDLPRSPQIGYKKSNTTGVDHIKNLEIGDIIMYQGSRYKVIGKDEFAIKVKSLATDKEMFINQGQLSQYGIKLLTID